MSTLRGGELRRKRRDLQLMFQDPHSSLDPRMRVGAIIGEPLAIQHLGSRREQRDRVFELLGEVGLPRNAVERYPHEFSGGQRQRIGLARALTLNPKAHRGRRAGQRAGRVDPGPGAQPDEAAAGRRTA